MTTHQTRWSQFLVLITVFFFWGFVAASNEILIPVFKSAFNLSQMQSMYVAMAFYVAYTVGSIIYFLTSKAIGGDLLNRIGYKNGIAIGLLISAMGTLLFYPAANAGSFGLMLSGLFIVGLGFSLQQIAANPLAIMMGDPATGAQRLTMAVGVNNFGTTIGPLLVSTAIFGSVSAGGTEASIEAVKTPYLVLGAAFVLVALLLVAMLSSKGAAGVTGAGFITLAATLAVVPEVPVAGMALILGIDRFMSECRALTNLVGNACATIVVARWENALDKDKLDAAFNGQVDSTGLES